MCSVWYYCTDKINIIVLIFVSYHCVYYFQLAMNSADFRWNNSLFMGGEDCLFKSPVKKIHVLTISHKLCRFSVKFIQRNHAFKKYHPREKLIFPQLVPKKSKFCLFSIENLVLQNFIFPLLQKYFFCYKICFHLLQRGFFLIQNFIFSVTNLSK